MLFGRRGCSFAPQRLQRGCSFPSARFNWWHSPQTRMPASIARIVVLQDLCRDGDGLSSSSAAANLCLARQGMGTGKPPVGEAAVGRRFCPGRYSDGMGSATHAHQLSARLDLARLGRTRYSCRLDDDRALGSHDAYIVHMSQYCLMCFSPSRYTEPSGDPAREASWHSPRKEGPRRDCGAPPVSCRCKWRYRPRIPRHREAAFPRPGMGR